MDPTAVSAILRPLEDSLRWRDRKKKCVSKKEKKQGRKRSAVNCLKVVMEVKQGEEGFKKGKWIQSQNIPWH